jgi:hypothetical protein
MNNRQEAMNVLNYLPYERMPVVHFGWWTETLELWAEQGHITMEEAHTCGDGNASDLHIGQKLGFDFNWYSCFHWASSIKPGFERKIMKVREDGSREVMNGDGVMMPGRSPRKLSTCSRTGNPGKNFTNTGWYGRQTGSTGPSWQPCQRLKCATILSVCTAAACGGASGISLASLA